jgi:hypothetical protein
MTPEPTGIADWAARFHMRAVRRMGSRAIFFMRAPVAGRAGADANIRRRPRTAPWLRSWCEPAADNEVPCTYPDGRQAIRGNEQGFNAVGLAACEAPNKPPNPHQRAKVLDQAAICWIE